jgi:pimeloyl-ACP methyl ester carboxylesterase
MPYATVNDVRLYYEREGQGEPLLLLHGGLGAVDPAVSSSWAALRPSLAERYRTFSLEHRGHGRSNNPASQLSYAQLAEDVAAFIAQLDLAPVHLAGASLGGEVGLALGLTRPALLRSLVCVGANYRVDAPTREALAFFDAEVLERDEPAFAAELARRHDAYHAPGYWRELVRQVRAMAEVGLALSEEDLRRIPVPTLLIAGEIDPFNGLEQALAMRRCIPDSEVLILNHAGLDGMANHRAQYTRPDVVGPVILDFLARAGPASVPATDG